MHGRKRRIASVSFAALGVISIVAMAWSRGRTLDLRWSHGRGGGGGATYRLWLTRGELVVDWISPSLDQTDAVVRNDPNASLSWWYERDPKPISWRQAESLKSRLWWGLGIAWFDSAKWVVFLQIWPISILLFTAGAFVWASARRARRAGRGRCLACEHDLTGLPASAPCPECGEPT